MMAAINKGVVSVAIDASSSKFQFYSGGIITQCTTSINHAVAAVGYGYDAASGLNYYLVKNSWGTSWGENGYFKLWNYGDGAGTCGV